jgi:uncharacterized lipoprotein YddW (UPF0748 family)
MAPLRAAVLAALLAAPLRAQDARGPEAPADSADVDSIVPPAVAREFRGVWVASVANIDWPSKPGLSTWEQQAELLAILDKAVALHLNAIVLQVRPSADALYASKYEPWSAFLTGRMGRAPEPAWDPLAFAVREAHARGLALHAWFNPFRARHPADTGRAAATHVTRRDPGIVHRYGPYDWMDPGSAETRRLAMRAILDVVKRYDIDGVHIDDYFYPYPETNGRGREIEFPDAATYRAYRKRGGTLDRDDWRRHNVDLFVEQVGKAIHDAKPWVLFGVSPFGIWRPGNPPSVKGFDAYTRIYADSRKWLASGWVDYLSPQLYWSIDSPGQGYAALLQWWVDQNAKHRHLWVGNYTSRVGATSGPSWRASEIVQQVKLTQQQAGAGGNIHFSMAAFMADSDSLSEKIVAQDYAQPALIPASPWLDRTTPARPVVTLSTDSASGERRVTMRPGGKESVWQWVVQARTDTTWTTTILRSDQRVHALLGPEADADVIAVTAVDRVGNASRPVIVRWRRSP